MKSVDGQDVATFLQVPFDDTEWMIAIDSALAAVKGLASGYTRGQGFQADPLLEDDLAAVVLTASARLVGNTEQAVRDQAGDVATVFTPFLGWSLVEQAVLNRYRKRAG